MASKERAPGPVVPVEHGSRPQLPKKKASIDFYRQLPFTRLKEKTTDQWQYAIASASGRAARFSASGIERNCGGRAAARANVFATNRSPLQQITHHSLP
jgi:hypothetical protein